MRKLRSDFLGDEQQERSWPGDGSSDPQVSRQEIWVGFETQGFLQSQGKA